MVPRRKKLYAMHRRAVKRLKRPRTPSRDRSPIIMTGRDSPEMDDLDREVAWILRNAVVPTVFGYRRYPSSPEPEDDEDDEDAPAAGYIPEHHPGDVRANVEQDSSEDADNSDCSDDSMNSTDSESSGGYISQHDPGDVWANVEQDSSEDADDSDSSDDSMNSTDSENSGVSAASVRFRDFLATLNDDSSEGIVPVANGIRPQSTVEHQAAIVPQPTVEEDDSDEPIYEPPPYVSPITIESDSNEHRRPTIEESLAILDELFSEGPIPAVGGNSQVAINEYINQNIPKTPFNIACSDNSQVPNNDKTEQNIPENPFTVACTDKSPVPNNNEMKQNIPERPCDIGYAGTSQATVEKYIDKNIPEIGADNFQATFDKGYSEGHFSLAHTSNSQAAINDQDLRDHIPLLCSDELQAKIKEEEVKYHIPLLCSDELQAKIKQEESEDHMPLLCSDELQAKITPEEVKYHIPLLCSDELQAKIKQEEGIEHQDLHTHRNCRAHIFHGVGSGGSEHQDLHTHRNCRAHIFHGVGSGGSDGRRRYTRDRNLQGYFSFPTPGRYRPPYSHPYQQGLFSINRRVRVSPTVDTGSEPPVNRPDRRRVLNHPIRTRRWCEGYSFTTGTAQIYGDPYSTLNGNN